MNQNMTGSLDDAARDEQNQDQPAQILAGSPSFVPTGFQSASAVFESKNKRVDRASEVDWRQAMRRAIRTRKALLAAVGLEDRDDPSSTPDLAFSTFAPLEFVRRIERGNWEDPLLKQVLPESREQIKADGFSSDPVGDLNSLAEGGLLHKYDGRALLVVTGACGVHCRYCFRREFPYLEVGSRRQSWDPSLEYLREHPEIEEVLLSGGDPLTVGDAELEDLVQRLERIDHLRRIRIHTRMPIVIPQRVTTRLADLLSASRLTAWTVVHCNHANEVDRSVERALATLIDRGIPVLNQAVLLRGVNDDVTTLIELSRRLIDLRVQPYYLHQLDRVHGVGHFEVPVEQGRSLMSQLRQSLPGYAVPTYVVEQPGRRSKTHLGPSDC